MSAATAAAQTVETQKLMSDRDRSHSFQMDKLEVSLYICISILMQEIA